MSVAMPYPKPIAASQQIPIEFPKWVQPASGGEPVLVNSADEEAAACAPAKPLLHDDTSLRPANRAQLIARAAALGIKVDGRWPEGRILVAIEMAEAGQAGA